MSKIHLHVEPAWGLCVDDDCAYVRAIAARAHYERWVARVAGWGTALVAASLFLLTDNKAHALVGALGGLAFFTLFRHELCSQRDLSHL